MLGRTPLATAQNSSPCATQSGDGAAGLGDEQRPRGHVPRLDVILPVAIEAATRDIWQIETRDEAIVITYDRLKMQREEKRTEAPSIQKQVEQVVAQQGLLHEHDERRLKLARDCLH